MNCKFCCTELKIFAKNEEFGFLHSLNDVTVDKSSTTLEDWLEDPTNEIKYVLVNGLLQPTLVMQPGQVKRFRYASLLMVFTFI